MLARFDQKMTSVCKNKHKRNSPLICLFEQLNRDIFLYICGYLDPFSLYYLSGTNHNHLSFARLNCLWKYHTLVHFSNHYYAMEHNLDISPHYYYELFYRFFKQLYKNVSHTEAIFFTLVRANDLYSINLFKSNKMSFTIKSILKGDTRSKTRANYNFFLDLVRQNNNHALSKYIFDKLCEERKSSKKNDEKKLIWGIKLDQDYGWFNNILLVKKTAKRNIYKIKIWGETLLAQAVLHDSVHSAQLLLKEMQFDPNEKISAYNYPLLWWAAQEGQLKICQLLLQHKAMVNSQDRYGCTPLHIAVDKGYTEICQLLLVHKACVDALYHNTYSPLYIAARNGHYEVIKVLCQFNPNYNYICANHSTALHVATQNNHSDIVKLLCKKLSSVNCLYKGNYTSLYIASKKGYSNIVTTLLACDALINYQTSQGESALHAAVKKGNLCVVEMLLANGAAANLPTTNGLTPLHIACINFIRSPNYMSIVQALIKGGANPLAKSMEQKTPSETASSYIIKNELSILETIIQHACINSPLNINYGSLLDLRKFIDNIINDTIPYYIRSMRFSTITNPHLVALNLARSKKSVYYASTALNLLKNTTHNFGHIVILFTLLYNNHHSSLMDSLASTLQFESVEKAKNALAHMIMTYLDANNVLLDSLKHYVILPILTSLNRGKDRSSGVYEIPILYLSFFEAIIKRSLLYRTRKYDTLASFTKADIEACWVRRFDQESALEFLHKLRESLSQVRSSQIAIRTLLGDIQKIIADKASDYEKLMHMKQVVVDTYCDIRAKFDNTNVTFFNKINELGEALELFINNEIYYYVGTEPLTIKPSKDLVL